MFLTKTFKAATVTLALIATAAPSFAQGHRVWIEQWDEDSSSRVREHFGMFTKEGFSAVFYPEVQYNFGGGFELHAGALVYAGQEYSKFGSAETGASIIWTRARYSF